MNEISIREKVQLIKEANDRFELRMETDEAVSVVTSDRESVYTLVKRKHLTKHTEAWREKQYQGRIRREATSADHKLSSAFLQNTKLKDSVVRFVVRGRQQLLQCNSLLAIYYPQRYSRSCTLCNHPHDTVSHVLNGCTKYQRMYQARHNRLVDLICKNLPQTNSCTVYKDRVVTPQLFQSDTTFSSTATRPDITIINEEDREVLLAEIAVPFDAFIDICYSKKFEKDIELCHEITTLGYHCRVIVIVIGSLGTVHGRVVSGLHLLGIPRYASRWLARYLSISSILGSLAVWQRRCSDARRTGHTLDSDPRE